LVAGRGQAAEAIPLQAVICDCCSDTCHGGGEAFERVCHAVYQADGVACECIRRTANRRWYRCARSACWAPRSYDFAYALPAVTSTVGMTPIISRSRTKPWAAPTPASSTKSAASTASSATSPPSCRARSSGSDGKCFERTSGEVVTLLIGI